MRFRTLTTVALWAFSLAGVLRAADGDLDTAGPGFGTGGKVVTDFVGLTSVDFASAVAVQADGKFVVVGSTVNGTSAFAVARYTTAGVLDTTFNSTGLVATQITNGSNEGARAVAIQSDQKIVVAGFAVSASTGIDMAVVRYNTNGTLDTTFGGTGIVLIDFATSDDHANAVALDGSGNIVVAGDATTVGNTDFAVARLTTAGVLDTSFDADGKLTTDFSGLADVGNAMRIQADGRIVVAGSSATVASGSEFAVARYNVNGSLDTAFDSDGRVTTDIAANNDDVAYALAIQTDNKLIVAGYTSAGANDMALVRYTTAGAPDPTFNTTGRVTLGFGGGTSDKVFALVLQPDGRIVVAGDSTVGGTFDFALARFSTFGALDTSFGGTGMVVTPFTAASDDVALGVAFSAGMVVAVGYSTQNNGDFALARYQATATTNTAPTITAIGNQTVVSGSSLNSVAFTVGDAQSSPAALTVSATSTNTTLVPVSAILFSGTGASRTLDVTPATGQTGSTTITVTVSDGLLTASSSFAVTVIANTAPNISAIADRTTGAGTPTPAIGFTIGDAQSAATALSVSGLSSNPALVPNSAIVFAGTGAARTVTVTPAAGQSGTALITITVSDGSMSAQSTFTLTVIPVASSGGSSSKSCGLGSGIGLLALSLTALCWRRSRQLR
ncbi:MAG: hypothetical protein H0W83_10685 [Planctomycetes bacterium]|nr:hypothetical protein [Planctomycetota bacterium]